MTRFFATHPKHRQERKGIWAGTSVFSRTGALASAVEVYPLFEVIGDKKLLFGTAVLFGFALR